MTVNIYPAVHDVLSEHPDTSGTFFPVNITPPTHEAPVEHRASASSGSPGPGGSLDLAPQPMFGVGRYKIEITDKNGGIIGALTNENPGVDKWTCSEIVWELNGMGNATISGPTTDAALIGLFDAMGRVRDDREITISRADIGVLTIVVPSPRAKPRDTSMRCPDVTYHLKKKYVGRNNEAPNLVLNGGFHTDLTNWSANSLSTMTWSASPFEEEPGAMVLTSGLAGNHYAYQVVTVPSLPYATFVWLSAWCYLDAAVDQRLLPTSGRGLWSVWRVGGTVVWQQGVSPDWRKTGDWQNIFTKIFVPANQAQTMEVRLYCPSGLIRWDDVIAHREERLNCEGDPSSIIGCLVAHAQDAGFNKTDMNITADATRGQGTVEIARRYKFAEAANILSAMGEIADLAGGVDWLLETPSSNTRTVFTMERTGYDVGSNTVDLEWGVNVNDFEFVWNVDRRADQIRVQGRGSGDEVTEAFADDPDSEQGWEFIRRTSIEGTPHPQFQADAINALYRRPSTLVVTVYRTADLDVGLACKDGYLKPGRIVNVKIDHGWVHVEEPFKILQTTFRPEYETATLQLVATATLEDV